MLILSLNIYGQKKEINEAKTYLKTNKNLDKAETLIRKAIKMPGHEKDIDYHALLVDALHKQYNNTNEQIYLRRLSDTASVFPLLIRLFEACEALDSLDAMPDKKGVVKFKYRQKNSVLLNKFRQNLYNGGLFNFRNKKYEQSFCCMDAYLGCEKMPLFDGYRYSDTDNNRVSAAYYAFNSAYLLKRHDDMTKYLEIAVLDKEKASTVLFMLYESALSLKDTLQAVGYLRRGFDNYPECPHFFPRLFDYYSKTNQVDTVRAIVNRALEHEPGNIFFRVAKNRMLLNDGLYDYCIAQGDSILHTTDKISDLYFNIGSAYYNKAIAYEKRILRDPKQRKQQRECYEKARPYLERFRKLRPKRYDLWAPLLYNVYLNLNMGKEFDEIDILMATKRNKT